MSDNFIKVGRGPFTIKVPAGHRVEIKAHTNALYRQKVDVADVLKVENYVMTGDGEDKPMTFDNGEPGSRGVHITGGKFTLPTIAHPVEAYRELKVTCTFSRPGETKWHNSEVWIRGPRETDDIDPNSDHEWEVKTEDGADDDRNDTVLHINAHGDW
ncbi:uncharacterized protein B0H64DRAFT_478348 [Chaetomium fimeti]|uniref:Uncharacterized protein n=1 Tax=Chaetomium fimeti TaxID=1854472 RepID=A0AAE0H7W0_9PEZI|nr:hypothetical protein B0H64DRAFT_478348 [Chaetomium fimeti]